MNILVMSWRDPKHPLAGGAEQVDHEHHKGWIAAGHSVTLFSSVFPGAKKTEEIDGVKIIREGNQILWVQIAAFVWYLFQQHEDFNLVVDEFHGIPFFTPLYIRKPKMAVLQEVAREVWLKNDLHFPLNFIFGYLGYYLEPVFFSLYKNIPFMVGSNSAKIELSKMGIKKSKIEVVPHGIVLDKPAKLPLKEKINTVVFLGALAKDKGIEDAIRTFEILNNQADWRFWIIGKGGEDYVSYLKKLCKKYDIFEKTRFWGFVSQKEKFILLSKSKIMINPSLLEGFGLVNIEANSVTTPVVSYNSPGLTDSVKDGVSGVIVDNNSPEGLAIEVSKIINDEKLYKKLQDGGVNWSKKFNWKESRELSLALVERLGLK
jgi:glycosyltransferase involved in cell wall biosynthesis